MILAIGTTPAMARAMTFAKVTIDAVNRARDVRVSAAGKAVNVARVACHLGADVTCIGIAGGDTGHAVRTDLDSCGVVCRFVESPHPTRVCVTVIDESTSQTTELVQEAPPSSAQERDALLAIVDTLAEQASVVVCSGTIAPGIGNDLYQTIATRVGAGRSVIVDAKGEALRLATSRGVIVKCNRTELCETFGGEFDAALSACFDHGAAAAVVSDGPRPTTVATRSARWSIASPAIKLVSPIGSGDAMAAGLAVGIERGFPIQEAAKLGVACAASNAMSTIAGDIDPAVVQSLQGQINVAEA